MKKIILASQSPQRRKLLKFLGLRFTVRPSRVREISKIKTTCSALVRENALRKALDVASRLKSGVVIGADTLVYVGNKQIIGKPRNLKEARRTLKILFPAPNGCTRALPLSTWQPANGSSIMKRQKFS